MMHASLRTLVGALLGLPRCSLGAASLSLDDGAGLRSLAQACPEGATCGDRGYTEAAYTCQDDSLKKGHANIIEYRCHDGGCMRTPGLCNGVQNCGDGSDEQGCDGVQNTTDAAGLAAPYDCSADFMRWKSTWSTSQKRWCCQNKQRGCSGSPLITAILQAPATVVRQDPPREQSYECTDWSSQWSDAKKVHCCMVESMGCTMTAPSDYVDPYDCDKVDEHWHDDWSRPKRDWCCASLGVNCPDSLAWALAHHELYDCAVNEEAGNVWSTVHWPSAKKEWCCSSVKVACDEGGKDFDCKSALSTLMATTWSDEQIGWCCHHEQVACPESTTTTTSAQEGAASTTTKSAQEAAAEDKSKAIQATMSCSQTGFLYEPEMAGYFGSMEPDLAACQARCASTSGCAHFSFWLIGGACQVHNAAAVERADQPSVYSGPPTCDETGKRELELLSDMMRERVCFDQNFIFLPLDSPAHGSLPSMASTPSECQQQCALELWCMHFTYSVGDSMCHLADSDATKVSGLSSVTGPQVCQDQVTFSLSVGGVTFGSLHEIATLEAAFKVAIKQAVVQVAGKMKDHLQVIRSADNESQMSEATAGDNDLVSIGNMEVVLTKGPQGGLIVGVMIAPSSEVPSSAVQKVLWGKLNNLEVAVANFIAQADQGRVTFQGVIHVKLGTPPALLSSVAGVENSGKDYALKFLEHSAKSRLAIGVGGNAVPPILLCSAAAVVLLFSTGFAFSWRGRPFRGRGPRDARSSTYVGIMEDSACELMDLEDSS
mmetsp:Transcript_63609/g.207509  ORF Transcript_63609/g.207509 Transcript_63609/m.207509 type:complete len:770 (-) Transcript_63609:205-2514(-)